MIKSVIFDLDGTLINSIGDIANSCNIMLKNHGYPVHPAEHYIKWVGNGALRLIKEALPEHINFDEKTLNDLLKEYTGIYEKNCTLNSYLYDGIPEVLDKLTEKGVTFSINTNKPHSVTLNVVNHYFKNWDFKYVIGQKPEGVKKPEPQAALFIAKNLGLKPSEMLFIGDSDVDAQTGKNAGMKTVGVTWGYRNIDEETGFDYIAAKPEDIVKIIENLNKNEK